MLHQRLRHDTREAHDRLERQLDLLSPTLTRARYATILERLLGFYRPWEPRVAALLRDGQTFRRSPDLTADLCRLGRSDAVPDCPFLPPLNTVADVLGSLYVTEGSRLGGQVITRHVTRLFGWPADHATRFFASAGLDAGANWRALKERLDAQEAEAEAVIAAAQRTFAAFAAWLPGVIPAAG